MRLNDSDSGPAGNGRSDLAKLFILYGLLAVALLALNMPPYQNVDEVSHFLRADAVSRGGLIGIPVPQGGGGGVVDDGIGQSARLYEYLKFRPDQKVTRAVAEPAKLFRSGNAEVLNGFANTAIYPPVLYAPAAAGIWMGNLLGLPVVQTLLLARLSTGVIAVALAAAAIIIAGPSAPFLFAVLTLPMSLALMASVSQDALILPLSAIAGGSILSYWHRGCDRTSPVLAFLHGACTSCDGSAAICSASAAGPFSARPNTGYAIGWRLSHPRLHFGLGSGGVKRHRHHSAVGCPPGRAGGRSATRSARDILIVFLDAASIRRHPFPGFHRPDWMVGRAVATIL